MTCKHSPTRNPPTNRHQSGQVVVETVLILALFATVAISIGALFRSEGILKQVVQAPWLSLAGMIEQGMWAPATPATAPMHPNSINRHRSLRGDER